MTVTFGAEAANGRSGQYIARITGRDQKYQFQREFVGRKGGRRNEISEHETDEVGLYECCDATKRGKDSRFYAAVEVAGTLRAFRLDKAEALAVAKALDAGGAIGDLVVGHAADADAAAVARQAKSLTDLVGWCRRMLASYCEAQAAAVVFVCRGFLPERDPPAGGLALQMPYAELRPLIDAKLPGLEAALAAAERVAADFAAAGKSAVAWYEIRTAKEVAGRRAAASVDDAVAACRAVLAALPVPLAKKVLAALKAELAAPAGAAP